MVLNRQHLSLERLYILINISMTLAKLFAPFIGAFGILSYAKCSIYLFVIFLVCYAGILFIASPVPTHDTTREPHDRGNRFSGYKPIFKNWNFILFVFFLLLITVCETSLYSSLPLYLKERFQETGVYIYTLTFSINEWIIASLFIFCRKAIEKLSSMDWIIASASLYSLIFLVLSKYGHLPKATLLLVICFSFAEITAKPIAYRLVIKLAEKGHSGKYQAVANLRFFLAGALSSFVGGLFIGKNNYYYGAFLFVSALSLPFAFIIRKSITRQLNK